MAKISFLGHSCFQIEINGIKIITDPFIKGNDLAKNIDLEKLEADYILVSHGHQDHIADLIELSKITQAIVISNFEITTWVESQGYSKVHPMNHGGAVNLDFGIVKMVNAVHSSSFPDGSYAGNPAGFVIKTKDKCVYFAGDTALHYDMKLIGEEFNLDFALLPIGDNFTMGISDAIKAAKFIQCNKIIGMHFDTFGYIKIDHEEALEAFSKEGVQLALMEVGATFEY